MELVIKTVYDAGDPSDGLRSASGQKKDTLGGLPDGVPGRVQQPANVLLKGRNPFRVRSIDLPWKIYEVFQLRFSFNGNDIWSSHDL
jgi:hypothetical protein